MITILNKSLRVYDYKNTALVWLFKYRGPQSPIKISQINNKNLVEQFEYFSNKYLSDITYLNYHTNKFCYCVCLNLGGQLYDWEYLKSGFRKISKLDVNDFCLDVPLFRSKKEYEIYLAVIAQIFQNKNVWVHSPRNFQKIKI